MFRGNLSMVEMPSHGVIGACLFLHDCNDAHVVAVAWDPCLGGFAPTHTSRGLEILHAMSMTSFR